MLTWLAMLRGLKFPSRKLLVSCAALALASGVSTACFKSLDESLLDDAQGGAGGSGGQSSGGSAGSGGTGGSSGSSGTAGSGAQDAGSDADDASDADAAIPITVIPWDSTKYPSTSLAGGATNALLSVDANSAYWVPEDAINDNVRKTALDGTGTTSGSDKFDRPASLSSPAISLFFYVGAGVQATDEGRLVRFEKNPAGANPAIELPYASSSIGHIVAMTITSENPPRLIVVAKTGSKNQPHILGTSLAGGGSALDLIYTDPDGNQTGGPIASDKHCIYWITNGRAYAVPLGGGSRVDALATQVTDATGLASDGNKIFVARANGEVWVRPVLNATCDGSGPAETRMLSGFTAPSELVSYADRIGFIAGGSDLGEGGIFSHVVGSTSVQQIVPASESPVKLRQIGSNFIYRTLGGVIAKVPDGTQ